MDIFTELCLSAKYEKAKAVVVDNFDICMKLVLVSALVAAPALFAYFTVG